MSRLYTRNARGRQPMLGSTTIKFSRSTKEQPNDTYQPNGKKRKTVQRNPTTKLAGKRKREDTPASEDSSSTFGGFDSADDASDEDSEEDADDDLPAVRAPSHSRKVNETGRPSRSLPDNISDAGSSSMFGDFDTYYEDDEDPDFSPEENRKRFEEKVFADSDEDDNEVYQAVDDISDSEDDLDERRIQQQELLAMLPEDELSDTDFINQIDGLSAYGFGDDSDGSIYRFPSSPSSDSAAEVAAAKHVHFATDAPPTMFMRMSESPTITRALLPSALPDTGLPVPDTDSFVGGLVDDLEDSDLTDDCLPEEALQATPQHAMEEREASPLPSPPSKKAGKKVVRRKGPRRGIFIDEGDKTSGILDSSGKIILMTNPHLLGEEFARRYGASQASSPDVGFAELIEESDVGDRDPMVLPTTPDIMLASLNSAHNGSPIQGQAIGPLEAFYPSDSLLFGDILGGDAQGDELGEDVIDVGDVIRFDSDSEDSDGLTSPLKLPRNQNFMGNDFAHLNNGNVTAFRRNADPAFAAMSKLPPHLDINLTSSPMVTPAPRRRKRVHSSPYTSSHYKGVTPVQRMRDPNNGRTPDGATPAKKRRLMT